MTYAKRSLRLYLANRSYVTATPAGILAIMLVLSILISVAIGMVNGFPLSPDIQQGMRENNAGAVYSIPGFLISLGALAVNRNFAMALAFGSTRRHFWFGTTMGFGLTAAITAAAATVMLAIEKATDHWFFGVHAFDVAALGNGDYVLTFAAVFVLAMVSLAIGALFGTVYRAFGTRGVVVSALGTGGLSIIAVLLSVANREAIAPTVESLGDWAAAVVTGLIAVLALAGSYAANRVARL